MTPGRHVDLGGITVTALTDAVVGVPREAMFPTVDDESWTTFGRLYGTTFDHDSWPARMGCFLIRTHEDAILVDSGVGPPELAFPRAFGTGGELPRVLADHGVDVSDIDTVLFTHLHADHVGWNADRDGRPVFPNARYVASEAAWASLRKQMVTEPDATAFAVENVVPLADVGVLETFAGDLELIPGVRTIAAPGHAPGHVAVLVEGSNATALLLGDAAAHPLQLTEPHHAFCFDEDPERAYDARTALITLVEPDRTLVSAAHFPSLGRLTELEGRLVWRALEDGT